MERSGGDDRDLARHARDKADGEERHTRNVVIAGLVLVLALGAVTWAVVSIIVSDSDTSEEIVEPIPGLADEVPPPPTEPPQIPTATAAPSPTPVPTATAAPSPTPVPTATAAPSPTPVPTANPSPGPVQIEGVRVNMARANWSTGNMQAAIYRALLLELGYEVNDPARETLAPSAFYPALARGQYDFWVNGWFPHHDEDFRSAGLSGVASPIGWQIRSGGLQGFLVDKATADANGITTLDDIGNNPRIASLFDLDGDGKADLMGCNHGWGCRTIINETIAANGWQNSIEQVSTNHASLFADSVERHRQGQTLLQYVWSPASFTAQLVPGEDVIWLSLDNPLPTRDGVANISSEECPGQPCKTGFTPADIRVVARNDFLNANPAAAKLFELVTISPSDVSEWALEYVTGNSAEADIRSAANRWIAENRATADRWIAAALVASGHPPPPPRPTPEPTPRPTPEPVNETPGEGVRVNMARANWTGGHMQAAIYQRLLQELGYDVSDPANATLNPASFYRALGEGRYDFWANGWFPSHARLIEDQNVEDLVQPIGNEIVGGGLQGFITDKATAERLGITMLDDIGNNPAIAAIFDIDGNGKADLMGCNRGWSCQWQINDTIAQNGWEDTIEQVSDEHAVLFDESVRRVNRGEPILQYIWTPARFTSQLTPGTDVIWLSVGNPLPAHVGAATLPADQCPGQPCETGFLANDIRVVARNDFLASNPAAATLFELVTIPAEDVSAQNLAYDSGASSEFDVRSAANRWIANNRAAVDRWLAAARAAG